MRNDMPLVATTSLAAEFDENQAPERRMPSQTTKVLRL